MSTPSRHEVDKRLPRRLVNILMKFFSKPYNLYDIKLTNNNPNQDFKSVKRPWEVEKFKLDRKIFSSWKIKNSC